MVFATAFDLCAYYAPQYYPGQTVVAAYEVPRMFDKPVIACEVKDKSGRVVVLRTPHGLHEGMPVVRMVSNEEGGRILWGDGSITRPW